MNMSKMDMINEGMEDWMEIQDIRAKMHNPEDWNSATSPFAIKKAKFRARNIGLSYWPALVEEWYGLDFDVKAYLRADEILSTQVGYKYGEVMPNGMRSNGGWDSYGSRGVSPLMVRSMWFASGCKLGDKFEIQVRTGVVAKKFMSVNQTADYCRGFKWLKHRNMEWRLGTKAIMAIGKLSPEFRTLAIQNLPLDGNNKVRIRDINWTIVKAGQDFLARFDGEHDRLRARAMLALTIFDDPTRDRERGTGGAEYVRKLLGYEEQWEALDDLAGFMRSANLPLFRKHNSYSDWIANAVMASRGHVMYHPSVVQFLDNTCIAKEDVAYKIMQDYGLDYVMNCRGLLVAIRDVLIFDPMLDLDFLRDYGRAMTMVIDDPYGLPPKPACINVARLFVDAYRLEPQMVHGFKACTYGMYVHTDSAAPMIEAISLYREGKMRKALTHSCMPRFVIINRDFGFNLNSSHDDQYEAINAKAINALIKVIDSEAAAKYSPDIIRLTNALGMEAAGYVKAHLAFEVAPLCEMVDVVHDIVNSHMPNAVMRPLSQQWNQFFRKNVNMLRYAGHVTEDMAAPVSVEAFAREMAKHKYRRGSEASVELLELATRLEMSNKSFEMYLNYIKRTPTKTSEMLPFVRIDGSEYAEIGSEYVLEKMHFDDISQLSIGEETACCQHLGGVGAPSAMHSYEEPSSATYVLRKNGNVVAEAWVWRNTEDGVVIDSIEGRSSVPVSVAAHAFHQMAIQLIGKLCIKKVFISTTGYGLTDDIVQWIPPKSKVHSTEIIKRCSYMDGRSHRLWVSAKMLQKAADAEE